MGWNLGWDLGWDLQAQWPMARRARAVTSCRRRALHSAGLDAFVFWSNEIEQHLEA